MVITDRMWARLLSSTNQPSFLSRKDIEDAAREEAPSTPQLDNAIGPDGNLAPPAYQSANGSI